MPLPPNTPTPPVQIAYLNLCMYFRLRCVIHHSTDRFLIGQIQFVLRTHDSSPSYIYLPKNDTTTRKLVTRDTHRFIDWLRYGASMLRFPFWNGLSRAELESLLAKEALCRCGRPLIGTGRNCMHPASRAQMPCGYGSYISWPS